MERNLGCSAGAVALIAVILIGGAANAQDIGDNGSQANTDVSVNPSLQSDVNASSGGNVFDMSSSGRSAPPGPSLPSFAGGPCMGISGGVSASGPGFSIGGGRSFEDESCQRRNWVQTLVGVSQHMPEVEANELKRVAIILMMQDEFVGQAFATLGYDTSTGQHSQTRAASAPTVVANAAPQPTVSDSVRAEMSSGCVTLLPESASPAFRLLLEARGCAVRTR